MRILVSFVLATAALAAEPLTRVEVCAAGVERRDAVAEARLPSVHAVRRVSAAGVELPFQADRESDGMRLTVLLEGGLGPDSCRTLEVATGAGPPRLVEPRLHVSELDDYQGQPALRIATPVATYYYHLWGAGFASLVDVDGNDWISYRPEGGFEGDYRGIPNIAPPQFHPGRPEGKQKSRILHSGPLRATIASETEEGQWRLVWDIFPAYARMTLTSKGPEPYWILYEGTPGGSFDPDTDFWFDSAGRRMPMGGPGERWNGLLPDPQWVYFGDRTMSRALFLALHEPDEHWDEFWHRGAGGMTVFGFGRGPKPQWQYLDRAPAHLTIGFIEDSKPEAAKLAVESAWRPLEVRVGERRVVR